MRKLMKKTRRLKAHGLNPSTSPETRITGSEILVRPPMGGGADPGSRRASTASRRLSGVISSLTRRCSPSKTTAGVRVILYPMILTRFSSSLRSIHSVSSWEPYSSSRPLMIASKPSLLSCPPQVLHLGLWKYSIETLSEAPHAG